NNFVDNFRTTTLPTYLDNNDFNDLWTNINRLVGEKEDYVDITELIKKFPMYSYFSFHYPEFGLAVKKDAVKKPAEQVKPTEPAETATIESSTESPAPVQTPTAEPAPEPAAPAPAASEPTATSTPAPAAPPTAPAEPAPAVQPTPKATEPATQTTNSTGQLAGVYENYPGTNTIKVLHFYVYNKKNPKEFSTKKLKFFVYKTDKSLLNS
ncbi:hypothetical protein, partial [Mesomycoplasma ovipneumoniae]